MRTEFIKSLECNQEAFGLKLAEETKERLADFFELVQEANPLLHLVAPSSPEELAVRHVLESLTLLEFLPQNARFADVGTGAGLPSIPCLIARQDLRGYLIESKEKKAGFLQTTIAKCKLADRAQVINKQFSEAARPHISYVTCRALDRFTQKVPQLLKWSGDSTLLFFGGPSLREELIRRGTKFREKLMPLSEQRYLFILKNRER